jgi:hypothetical protein
MRDLKKLSLLGLIVTVIVFGCTKENTREPDVINDIDFDTLEFEHSMKGWELYSWPNGVDWNFAILPGTNVLKNYDGVISSPYTVTGKELLKTMLSKMPENEEIIWMSEHWLEMIWADYTDDLMLPPEDIVLDIDNFCISNGLILTVAY